MKPILQSLVLGLAFFMATATPTLARAGVAGDAMGSYKVVKGDSLWTIAAQEGVYGNPWVWPLLLDENQDKIDNPDLIYPGWMLRHSLSPSALRIQRAKEYASHYGEDSPWPAKAVPLPLMAGRESVAALQNTPAPLPAQTRSGMSQIVGPALIALALLVPMMMLLMFYLSKRADPYQEMPRDAEAEPMANPEEGPLVAAQLSEGRAIILTIKTEETPEIHEDEEHQKAA